jgi:hypothetical protein
VFKYLAIQRYGFSLTWQNFVNHFKRFIFHFINKLGYFNRHFSAIQGGKFAAMPGGMPKAPAANVKKN